MNAESVYTITEAERNTLLKEEAGYRDEDIQRHSYEFRDAALVCINRFIELKDEVVRVHFHEKVANDYFFDFAEIFENLTYFARQPHGKRNVQDMWDIDDDQHTITMFHNCRKPRMV